MTIFTFFLPTNITPRWLMDCMYCILLIIDIIAAVRVAYSIIAYDVAALKCILCSDFFSVQTPCSGNPCGVNGACTISGSGYSCNCNVGYMGTHCEHSK